VTVSPSKSKANPPPKSRETLESDIDAMSSSSPNNSEADSEDLEAVTPRKSKSNKVASGSNPGNSYP
jgi:hypothetical protein